jgi:integrase
LERKGLLKYPKDRQRIAWAKSFKTGQKWFLKLRKQYGEKIGTQKHYAKALKRFCKYMKMNPDEIIAQYKEDLNKSVHEAVDEWNDKIDLFVPWLIDTYKIGRVTASGIFCAIKSFFDYNASIGLSAKMPEFHSVSLLPVAIDDLRDKVLPFTDLTERFIILFLKDSGVSQAEALRFSIGDIEDLKNGFGYMRVFRRKEGIDYETFVGPNTMDLMKKYLAFRKQSGFEVTDDSPLFVNKKRMDKRLTVKGIIGMLWRLSGRIGVKVSTHRLRKTFETYLALGKVHPIILKYWMGHKVKGGKGNIEGKYIIPPKPDQIKLYMEAYKHIDISPKPDETALFLAETRTRMQALPPEQRQRFLKEITTAYRSRTKLIMSDKRIKELLEESNITQGGLAFGGHKFEEIDESQLLTYLRAGWKVTHNLQNGRVIVQR